jgi:predicted secreted acid phosphatase
MGLEKAIEHGKEKRKPYRGAKSFVRSCRNHGGCGYCLSNRTHKYKRQQKEIEWTEQLVVFH